jgi:LacI family transcriptional regulator
MVTIVKIAKLSGFSISTVSKALNDYPDISAKTKQKIIKISRELGYIPNASAQNLVTKRSNTIGVVYEIEQGLKNLFFSEFLNSFREIIEQKNFDILLLSNKDRKGLDYVDHSRFKQVDAILIVAGGRNLEALERIKSNHLPMLTLDPPVYMNNSIYSDSYEAIKQSCNYLYQLGHRRIAFVQGNYRETFIGKNRFDGYIDFMKEKNLDPIWIPEINNISYSIDEGYMTMQAIFETHGLPEALCVSSDLMAFGAIKFLKDNGFKVPEDVSVIGFDNLQFCDLTEPRLTTIKQDYKTIGRLAAEMLVDMIETKSLEKDSIMIPTSIVIRESCKKKSA